VGLTVLDAGVVIALLDSTDAHHAVCLDALRTARDEGDPFVLPASAYAECLVGPSRRGPEAVAVVDELLDTLPIAVAPISRAMAKEAARLRAVHGRSLRLPDALVLATARVMGADRVLTTDAGWPDGGIRVTVLAARER
jgi:predicted nucleic acid-binding protein